MADNTTLNTGSGGDVTRSIDKSGVKTQVVTLDLGGSGAESLPSGTIPVSGTVTATISAGASTIAKAEDTASANADTGVAMLAVRKATPANTSDTDGDYEFVQMSAGRVWVSAVIDSALPAGTNAIGKLAANSGVDIGDVDITSIAAGDNNIGNVDIVTVPTDPFGANADAASASGSISAKLRFIASTGIPITGTVTVGSHAVTNAGTFAVQVDGAALTALQLIDDAIFADDASFTIGTSKMMAVGKAVVAHSSAPDAADAGDAAIPIMNRHRIPFVLGGHPNLQTIELATTAADSNVAIISVTAGSKIVVTGFQVTSDNACTVFPSVRVGFGATTTPTTSGVIGSHPGLPAGGGFGRGDGSGILGIGADGEDLRWTIGSTPTGGSIRIVVTYFTIES